MKKTYVWDWGVRGFHWLLVLSLLGSYLTAEQGWLSMDWHFRFGYLALGLICFRVIWGFIGNEHARFADFLRGPAAVFAYIRGLFARNHQRSLGHSALGGWASMVLLLAVALQASTGLMTTDDIFMEGPLARHVSTDTVSLMTRIHAININVIYGLVALHLSAIAFYLFGKRENLIAAMLSGKKSAVEGKDADSTRWGRLILAAAVAASLVGGLVWLA